jgi:hypothetical protein
MSAIDVLRKQAARFDALANAGHLELHPAARVCNACAMAADALESGNYKAWYREVHKTTRAVVVYGILSASTELTTNEYRLAIVLLDKDKP